MGFFSDLKEDLSQAVNELLPEAMEEETSEKVSAKGAIDEPETKEESLSLDDVDLSEMLDKLDQMGTDFNLGEEADSKREDEAAEESADILKAAEDILTEENGAVLEEVNGLSDEVVNQKEMDMEQYSKEETSDAEEKAILEKMLEETDLETLMKQAEEEIASETESEEETPVVNTNAEIKEEPVKEEERKMDVEQRTKRVATDEVAVVTEGMTIRGDVETEGSLDLIGKVIGNIDILGKLNITGTVEGNSSASEIYAERAHIIGELKSDGALKIGQSSVIIGNVYGSSAVVAGAIKGDIDVKGPVILDSTAIVMGNIKSKSVQINNGAVIEGMCSQCYADVSPTSFFSELKNM